MSDRSADVPAASASDDRVLSRLAHTLESRKGADAQESYVASLYAGGLDRILQKLGEEAVETILAAKQSDPDKVVYETADLWFHSLVMLAQLGLRPEQVLAELERRSGTSGHEEKAARQTPQPRPDEE